MKFVRVLSLTTAVAVTVYSSIGGAACEISPGFEGLNTTVKGYPIPRIQPVQGVDYVNVEQVAKLVDNPSYVFIDVRPAGFFKVCRLSGSTNLEYTFAGPGG